jgi:hypothetical protein
MFCPKCSQQQVSDETRFCSRCGFQLNVVKALLSDESLSQNTQIQNARRSFNKRDMTIGAALMFVFAFIAGAITVDMPSSSSVPLIFLTIMWFVLVLLINIKPIIQYFLRPDSPTVDVPSKTSPNLFSKFSSNALPTAQSIPAEDLIKPRFNTAEMAQPLSVTEPTTNLLDKKEGLN